MKNQKELPRKKEGECKGRNVIAFSTNIVERPEKPCKFSKPACRPCKESKAGSPLVELRVHLIVGHMLFEFPLPLTWPRRLIYV